MNSKSIAKGIALIVFLFLIIGGVVYFSQMNTQRESPPLPVVSSSDSLPPPPPTNLSVYDLTISSPAGGTLYTANDVDTLAIRWSYPTQLIGKTVHRDIYLQDQAGKYNALETTSFKKDIQVTQREDSFDIPVSSELPPGIYTVYIWIQDYATRLGYGAWSGNFTIQPGQ